MLHVQYEKNQHLHLIFYTIAEYTGCLSFRRGFASTEEKSSLLKSLPYQLQGID